MFDSLFGQEVSGKFKWAQLQELHLHSETWVVARTRVIRPMSESMDGWLELHNGEFPVGNEIDQLGDALMAALSLPMRLAVRALEWADRAAARARMKG